MIDRSGQPAPIIPDDVPQNVADCLLMAETPFPICCVVVAGSVIAQGAATEPPDPRGFVKTDMHGRLAIDVGGKIVVGRPIASVRR